MALSAPDAAVAWRAAPPRSHAAPRRHEDVRAALSRLREGSTVAQLVARTPVVVVQVLGYRRAALSTVEQSVWTPAAWHDGRDAASTGARALEAGTPEAEAARRRTALLVCAPADPVLAQSPGYVVAPISIGRQTVGLLHVDRGDQQAATAADRDQLAAFTEGLSCLVERTRLLEQLRADRRAARVLAARLEASFDDVDRVTPSLGGGSAAAVDGAGHEPRAATGGHDPLRRLLTDRELEVAHLLATGARNAEIAARLVISEGTVKSHVKHILRKLRAANRAEAVSKFMRLSACASASA